MSLGGVRRWKRGSVTLFVLISIPLAMAVINLCCFWRYASPWLSAYSTVEDSEERVLNISFDTKVEKEVQARINKMFDARVEEAVQARINEQGLVEQRDTEEAASNMGLHTSEDLAPDPAFVASDKYKKMYKHANAKYDLESLRRDFENKGVITFEPKFPEGVIDGAANLTQECLDKCDLWTNDHNKTVPDWCADFHMERFIDVAAVRDVALNYDILSVLAVLHGHDPYPFQTLNYAKSSLARTHSDYVHFGAHPVALMSAAWVALMDVDPDAGPVFYYEGSHKIPPYNMQDFGLGDRSKDTYNYGRYQDIMTATMEKHGFAYREAVIKKGWVLIWSANLVHGGPMMKNPNLKRLSQVTHYFFRNSNYNWAPVASEINENAVTFYDESAVDYKFSNEDTMQKRKAKSKFVIKPCDFMTKDKPDIPSPCDHRHGVPQVLSNLLHRVDA